MANGCHLLIRCLVLLLVITEGGFGEEGLDGDILGGDEEGGGWDVGDEDLVLPPDLVSLCKKSLMSKFYFIHG